MVHSFGPEGGKRAALVKDIEKIVRAEVAMWSPPEFDEYTFLIQFAADNLENTAISYYPKGELIGMVMDLLVRGRTKGKASLDDVMRDMYEEFYLKSSNNSYYLRGRGYQTEDEARSPHDPNEDSFGPT